MHKQLLSLTVLILLLCTPSVYSSEISSSTLAAPSSSALSELQLTCLGLLDSVSDPAVKDLLTMRYKRLHEHDVDGWTYLKRDLQYFIKKEDAWRYQEKENPKVVITIIHYGDFDAGTRYLIQNLNVLTYKNIEVLLLDSNSPDNLYEKYEAGEVDMTALAPDIADRITVMHSPVNLGYCAGNNYLAYAALDRGADFIFNINNDAAIGRDAIEQLIMASKKYPELAVISPAIDIDPRHTLRHRDGSISDEMKEIYRTGEASDRRLTGVRSYMDDKWVPDSASAGQGVSSEDEDVFFKNYSTLGTAVMWRQDLFRLIGGFDSRLFMYADEHEIGARVWNVEQKLGMRQGLVRDAFIFHPFDLDRLFAEYHMWRNPIYNSNIFSDMAFELPVSPDGRKNAGFFQAAWPNSAGSKHRFTPEWMESVFAEFRSGEIDARAIKHYIAFLKAIRDGFLLDPEPVDRSRIIDETAIMGDIKRAWDAMTPDEVVNDIFNENDLVMSVLKVRAFEKYELSSYDLLILDRVNAFERFLLDVSREWNDWLDVDMTSERYAEIRMSFNQQWSILVDSSLTDDQLLVLSRDDQQPVMQAAAMREMLEAA